MHPTSPPWLRRRGWRTRASFWCSGCRFYRLGVRRLWSKELAHGRDGACQRWCHGSWRPRTVCRRLKTNSGELICWWDVCSVASGRPGSSRHRFPAYSSRQSARGASRRSSDLDGSELTGGLLRSVMGLRDVQVSTAWSMQSHSDAWDVQPAMGLPEVILR
jgi:hypothetical protein